MRRHFILTTLLCASVFAAPASAGSWIDHAATGDRVSTSVTKDDTVVMRTDAAFKEVRVANADIADIVVLTDRSFQILGKTSGKTNVMLYDANRRLIDIVDVSVGFDLAGLKLALYETFPHEKVSVRAMAGGVYLSGKVSTDGNAQRIEKIAQAYAPGRVTNGLAVRDSHQVMLEVRFVEATRDAVKELGISMLTQKAGEFAFQSGGGLISGAVPSLGGALLGGIGQASLDTNIEALEEKGIIRTLAEPNLVAMSGETASFLAGGEFPVPVQAELGRISIEFRQFGVGLSFTPTVLDDGIINLRVAPEVSQIDNTNAVRVGSVEVPSLRVRRADTTVELRNDQSFAIAGLLQNDSSDSKVQVPWLGDVPVIGALFRSARYQSAETELVIIVTPRLVQPVSDISQLATPLDTLTRPSEAGAFLGGLIEGAPHGGTAPLRLSQKTPSPQSGDGASTPSATKPAKGGMSAQYGHALQ